MPNIAFLPYHQFPNLRVVLDFLGRCALEGQHMAARYPDARGVSTADAACRQMQILPLVNQLQFQNSDGNRDPRPFLCVSASDWYALSKNVLPMVTGQLRMLFQAVDDANGLTPVPWEALALTGRALAAWGTAAGMIALPLEVASSYLACRYPANSVMRRTFEQIDNVARAGSYKTRHDLGFLVAAEGGANYLACHGKDWRNELASSTTLLKHHLMLTIRLGLQLARAGDTTALPDMCWALASAGEAPLGVKLHGLLQNYMRHIAANAPGRDPLARQLLYQCGDAYLQWQRGGKLLATEVPRPALPVAASGIGVETPLSSIDHRFQSGAPKRKRDVSDVSGGDRKRARIGGEGQDDAPVIRHEPGGTHAGVALVTVPDHVVLMASQAMIRAPKQTLSRMAISSTINSADNSGHIGISPSAFDGGFSVPCQRAVTAPANLHAQSGNQPAAIRPFAAFMLSTPDFGVERTWHGQSRLAPRQGETRDAAPASVQIFPIPIFQARSPWS